MYKYSKHFHIKIDITALNLYISFKIYGKLIFNYILLT